MPECPKCGFHTRDDTTYADTQGGHNDRHTLVVEAAERLIETRD